MTTPQHVTDIGTAAAVAASVATPPALALGFDPIALLLALLAAVGSTFFYKRVDTRTKAFAGVLLATLLGGYGAPAIGEVLVAYAPQLRPALDVGRPLVVIMIGIVSPLLLPSLPSLVARAVAKFGGSQS